MNRIIPLACCLLLILLNSCRSQKDTQQTAYTPQTEAQTVADSPFARLTSSYVPWTDVSVPVKIELRQPKRFSVSGTLKMVSGESIHLSARMLGFEVGSAYVDNDSVLIVAKMADLYYRESLSRFTAAFGLTVGDIQNFLLGRLFAPGASAPLPSDEKRYRTSVDGDRCTFSPPSASGLELIFSALLTADGTPEMESLTVSKPGSKSITCTYTSPMLTASGPVASAVAAKLTAGRRQVDASVTYTLERSQWNKGVSIRRPVIPAGAKTVSTDRLLKILQSL